MEHAGNRNVTGSKGHTTQPMDPVVVSPNKAGADEDKNKHTSLSRKSQVQKKEYERLNDILHESMFVFDIGDGPDFD